MHTATNATIATTLAKGINVKLSKNIFADIELNQNKLWSCRLSKGRQSNIAMTAYSIN